MKKLALSTLLVLSITSVFAGEREDKIFNDPSIKAIATLMNQKHGGKCIVPSKEEDIRWGCYGLVFGDTNTFERTGCSFMVMIDCGVEKAEISGHEVGYLFNKADGSTAYTEYTDISINDIRFTK